MAWDDIPDWSVDEAKSLLAPLLSKDKFTYDHCLRVGRSSRKLAKAMGLNEFEQAIVEYAGLFHDLGKARIPTEILIKPGRLDRNEIEVIKTHPTLSAEMIQHLDQTAFFRFMLPGIKYHHEKLEGTGYPNSLRGEGIPLFARLIAVTDSYDAMTNARPYRNALSEDKAVKELKDFSGTQFDTHIVKTFLQILEEIKTSSEASQKEEVIVSRLIKAA